MENPPLVSFSTNEDKAPRAGVLKFPEFNNLEIPTPNFFLYTENCQVPFITRDLLDEIFPNKDSVILINMWNLVDICDEKDMVALTKETDPKKKKIDIFKSLRPLSKFFGFLGYPICVTYEYHSMSISKKNVTGTTKKGRKRLSKEESREFIFHLRPDLHIDPFFEPEVMKATPDLKKFTQVRDDYKNNEFSSYYGNVEVIPFNDGKTEYEQYMEKRYSIGNQFCDSSDMPTLDAIKWHREVIEKLNRMKSLRFLPGRAQGPLEVMHNIQEIGIDFFNSHYPFHNAKLGIALTFSVEQNLVNLKTDRLKMNLLQKKFELNKESVVKNCPCRTCRDHSCGYIHHLLACNEMTGFVLVAVHNLMHWKRFFESIRKSLGVGSFVQYKEYLRKISKLY